MSKMSEPSQKTESVNLCPVCSAVLPAGMAPSRCPQCLLRVGLGAHPVPALLETEDATGPSPASFALPQPGSMFGHYHIVRLLGKGGMGAVFEAEDLDCSRRVALKVLGHKLDSPEARSRFFREGRLAASISHPNSVYVYGTEEIAGIPVIAMELAGGGTLQDRVSNGGPLPVSEAADCVLQLIAGLEAAQRVGVLHRDIKPSNCFVETDGTVKIGDFGLSISTRLRTEPSLTVSGAILGTPAFSSPEQMRGDEVTARSDIYAVGVTLYYLLTGHHVFTAGNLVQLIATVLERRPESPAKWRPQLPQELCRTVLRCLEKAPDKRFRDYDELRAALLPYASTAPSPATLGWRVLAFYIDLLILGLARGLVGLIFNLPNRSLYLENYWRPSFLLIVLGEIALGVGYFGVLEGRWSASLGKALCGLRVARLDRTRPGMGRSAWRAVIFMGLRRMPDLVLGWVCLLGHVSLDLQGPGLLLFLCLSWALTALAFSTARRRNGFAAWHDLASGTRVIRQEAYHPRPALPVADDILPDTQARQLVGPYHVLKKIGGEEGAEVFLGFDPRLLRRVWLRQARPSSPPVPLVRRQLGRAGRLRWLNGSRTANEAWDAYEAVPGRPLLGLIAERRPWSHVRFWLLDLAEELKAAEEDGSLPDTLDLSRVWITAGGRAKLLDFPAPGTEAAEASLKANPEPVPPTPTVFLRCVALSALEGRPCRLDEAREAALTVPLALPARHYLEAVKQEKSLVEQVRELRSLLARPASVSCARRIALLAGSLAVPLLVATVTTVDSYLETRFLHTRPELTAVKTNLDRYEMLHSPIRAAAPPARVSEALEICVVAGYSQINLNQGTWSQFQVRKVIYGSQRQAAERFANTRKLPTQTALAEAEAIVSQFFSEPSEAEALRAYLRITPLTVLGRAGYLHGVVLVVLPCLLASLVFGGGALPRALGVAFVNYAGAPLSRPRVAWRNLVAWLPFLALPWPAGVLAPLVGDIGGFLLAEGICAVLGLASAMLPQRGLQDRLTGTWLVPR